MNIKEFTMKSGSYFRVSVENPEPSWWAKVADAGGFANREEMCDAGYDGETEIEGYLIGEQLDGAAAVYFFDRYEKIGIDLTTAEKREIADFALTHWEQVPDNAELGLGDVEWYERAYAASASSDEESSEDEAESIAMGGLR